MCGIICALNIKNNEKTLRKQVLRQAKKLRHRGPDWSGIFSDNNAILAHERLSIVDIVHGAQPLYNTKTSAVLAVNGEIYNHADLEKQLRQEHEFQTKSDCEVVLYLYEELGPDCVEKLNGIFAFVLYDPNKQAFLIARDHMGIIPLYLGWDTQGVLYAASEMKALIDICETIEEFPPGSFLTNEMEKPKQFYKPGWSKTKFYPSNSFDPDVLRDELTKAVERQLMCDVPYGLLLSGGVDSSIIAAIASQFKNERIETHGDTEAWWPQLHSFSVGLEDSPDTKRAKLVADHIGTVHHEILFTVQEGIDALSDVIYHLETFDVTTIRASTPMYLMARWIKSMGIKMVLSGEGADEIFGGYLYFHKAPNAQEFHAETVRKLFKLHQFDCLRANKSTAAWGLETRVPFLDKEFMNTAMSIDPGEKMITENRKEKYILRKAFDGYLPDEILWRQKEQFSDGVGYSWIDGLKNFAENEVSDTMMSNAQKQFPVKTPTNKEEYVYRSIFEQYFPGESPLACIPTGPSIACSTPEAIAWEKSFAGSADPSGRSVTIHEQSY